MKMLWKKLWKGFTGSVPMPGEVPTHAFVLSGGEEHWVETVNVRPGDTLLIYPGERIPVDGVIVEGQSFLEPWEKRGKILRYPVALAIKYTAMKREADKAQAAILLQFYRADDVGSLFPGDIFM